MQTKRHQQMAAPAGDIPPSHFPSLSQVDDNIGSEENEKRNTFPFEFRII